MIGPGGEVILSYIDSRMRQLSYLKIDVRKVTTKLILSCLHRHAAFLLLSQAVLVHQAV